jgi:SAM-dependent methyltransferase
LPPAPTADGAAEAHLLSTAASDGDAPPWPMAASIRVPYIHGMKRIELFEFEDSARFPGWLRDLMTAYIQAFHRVFRTAPAICDLIRRALEGTPERRIVDLCSGAGGPMLDVARTLRQDPALADLELVLTDLYPNEQVAARVAALGDPRIRYRTDPVDATRVGAEYSGVRTLVGSFHHLPPEAARAVLLSAARARQPLVVFELSNNGPPRWLWWTAIPGAFLLALLLTPFARPLSARQLFFTYLVPLVPLFIAWDGAASNARTYTPDDVRELLGDFDDRGYTFEIEARRVGRLPTPSVTILGRPVAG